MPRNAPPKTIANVINETDKAVTTHALLSNEADRLHEALWQNEMGHLWTGAPFAL
jgi:hypothetical protein